MATRLNNIENSRLKVIALTNFFININNFSINPRLGSNQK